MSGKRLFSWWVLLTVGLTVVVATPARADTQTYTASFSGTMMTSSYGTTVTVPKFYDPSGIYTLQSVHVSIAQGTMQTSVGLENLRPDVLNGSLTVTGSM